MCLGECSIVMRGETVGRSFLTFLQSSRQAACSCMKEVFTYNRGFNSYYVPTTVRGAFPYFISFYSHKSFVRQVRQPASHSQGNRLKCLAQGHLASPWQDWEHNPCHLIPSLMLFALFCAILWDAGNCKSPCDIVGCQPSEIRTHRSLDFLRWE